MNDYANSLVQNLNLEVIEVLDLPGRPERRLLLPPEIKNGPLARTLDKWAADGQLWRHQTLALQALVDLHNVVVSTGTASGKSLVFQLRAFDLILRDRGAKVLVFYPLKALSSDQLARWQRMAVDLGLDRECVARIDGDVITTERTELLRLF